MAKVRVVVFALVLAVSTCAIAHPARAGGSNWDFDHPFYEPGDLVVASAAVSWAHYDTLGTPEDGPYGAWITRVGSRDPWPGTVPLADLIERSRYVGDVRIEPGFGDINGMRVGPNIARVEFRLPQIEPGLYSLMHCNYPCTTQLGDITNGVFWVGPPDPDGVQTSGHSTRPVPPPSQAVVTTSAPPPPTTLSPTTTTMAATVPTSRADLSGSSGIPAPVVALGAIALVAAGAVALIRMRPRAGAP
jgi:hypothetical protein